MTLACSAVLPQLPLECRPKDSTTRPTFRPSGFSWAVLVSALRHASHRPAPFRVPHHSRRALWRPPSFLAQTTSSPSRNQDACQHRLNNTDSDKHGLGGGARDRVRLPAHATRERFTTTEVPPRRSKPNTVVAHPHTKLRWERVSQCTLTVMLSTYASFATAHLTPATCDHHPLTHRRLQKNNGEAFARPPLLLRNPEKMSVCVTKPSK